MSDDHEHGQDILLRGDGTEEIRDPWVVETDTELTGTHSGTVCVHHGSAFTITRGSELRGTLSLRPGSSTRIDGKVSGTLHVSRDAVVTVVGDQSGTVHVAAGGLVEVARGGKLAGTLSVGGLIINRGTRGGAVSLHGGEIRDVDGGVEKQPEVKNGQTIYRW